MKSNLLSKEFRLNYLYKIVDKNWNTITFKMNKVQKELFDYQKENKRVIILKSRQLGLSTYKIIESLDRALFYSNQTCIITAHKQNKMQELFEKAKFAYDNLPDQILLNDWRVWNKPKAHYNNANELYFKDINSKIKVSLDSRSWTPTSLHITELAFMNSAKEMWTWSMPSIPVNAPITVETTANWIWNFFYDLWIKYSNKKDWEFKTLFFPWYDEPWYELDLEIDYKVPDELRHLETLWLDRKKINWYVNQYDILWKEVFQEYPTTPWEAFLTTWNPVFNIDKIKNLKTPEYKQDLKYTWLRIYRNSNINCLYWVDTSWGWINWDNSVIIVRDRDLNLLATFYDKVNPDVLSDVIKYLYELWYKAEWTLWVEINNTWISTIDNLKNHPIIWRHLYWRRVVDERTQQQTKKLWFNTNIKTRPLIINNLEEAIRKNLITEVDERIKNEMFTFIYNDNWKPEAMIGSHDDWVMGEAICLFMNNIPKQLIFW